MKGRIMKNIRDLLRSPRETLGGYVFLPRLIDKVRLYAEKQLPEAYCGNLLKPSPAIDGRFLEFKKIDPEEIRKAILESPDDRSILSWVEQNGVLRSDTEKKDWIRALEQDIPNAARIEARSKIYSGVASRFDLSQINVFDLIDLDEERIQKPLILMGGKLNHQ
ncbi:MAG: DUF5069 domain-containing protein [Leptospirales bacterium]